MKNIFYKPKDGWVGDTIPFAHDGKFYIYYLHDERKGNTQDEYGYRTSWNLLITEDGVNIKDCKVVLPVGEYDDADYACYTGSVIEGNDGKFHMFYTAQNNYNPKYHRDGKPLQYVAHAISTDLINWEKLPELTFGADESIYEPFDWRDPFVFYNEDEKCFDMLLAARLRGASEKNGGCVGLCRSYDLIHWEAKEPFYNPESYMTHECPDLFKLGNKWYLVYSTFSEKFVTHYRMSDKLSGPWTSPIEDTFDGRAFYAAKTAQVGDKRMAFAWVPTKRGESDFGQYEWGGNFIAHEIDQTTDNKLTVKPADGLINMFNKEAVNKKINKVEIENFEGEKSYVINGMKETCMIEAVIEFSEGVRSFGIGLRQDSALANGYYLRFEPFYNRIVADMWPRRISGVNQWYVDGDKPFMIELERPFDYKSLKDNKVHIRVVADGSIICLYVNNTTALTMRAYNMKRTNWGFFVKDGSIRVSDIHLYEV
ncbi:glycosyl hydrolase family 32 N-terminal domain protein [Lachnoanaerobaculum sp. ICM7]|uniref:glycoside hydrolase family 32 protein n=1 Tax=Lachnoanaerobaculum sp. ICM7 TaxID=936594 RepID=UPI00027A5501|nr:glycoside hydrolase family 32 protein [Lachnoanaerobaculum sp. ICM7]EJP20158.1 glycosyl hydrolase family 32 N-terminal domain protein [Lachnoanaerobaculum sp. ICM7]